LNDSNTTSQTGAARRPASAEGGGSNVVDLVSQLTRQGAHLAQEQIHLMQAEVREGVNDAKQAIGAYAGAVVVGISGLGVTLMGAGYLLGDALDNIGLGILIVGVVSLILAAILYSAGKKKASAANLKPERSIRTAEDMPAAATGNMNTAGGNHGR